MDVKNLFKKDYIVGIDIGSYSVKLVQMASAEDGLRLVKAELKDIAASSDSESYAAETVSALRSLIR